MSRPQAPIPDLPVSPRLNSWKEIAAYLGRDARTVQRWEKREGLPVHRYWHESQPSVYAITAELDAWLASRGRESPGPGKPARGDKWTQPKELARLLYPAPHRLRRISGATAALILLMVLILQPWHVSPMTRVKEGTRLLVGNLENRTGDSLFDGTLKAALERELSHSRFIRLAGAGRVDDALRLMKKPHEAKLDVALAREVARRDPDIRVFLTGRVEKAGSAYLLTVDLTDTAGGRVLAASRQTADGQDQIWPAVRNLSNWVRKTLGEPQAEIDRNNLQLEKIRTPSLRALQLFSQAELESLRSQWHLAKPLYRQALAEDPDFAMTHLGLARALSVGASWEDQRRAFELKSLAELPQDLKQARDYELQRALELAAAVGEPERYLIQGAYYSLTDEFDQAVPVLEAAVKLQPDAYFAYSDLATAYRKTGRRSEAANVLARLADLRPNDFRTQANVAQELWNIDLQRASQYARQAILLARQEDPRTIVWSDFHYVFTLPFFDQWRRDARAALTEIDSLAASFGNAPDKYLAWRIGECYLALGRVNAARKWFNRTLPHDFREEGRVYASYAEGDEQGARARLSLFQDRPKLGPDLLFIVPRLLPHPERLLPLQSVILGKQDGGPRHYPGEVALSQGRVDDAISSLQYTFDKYPGLRTEQMVAESLVKALELSDNQPKALEVLVEARRRDRTMQPIFWVRNLAHLAASYRKLGREPEAREIEDELRQLLAVADPDFYIVKQLRR